MAANVTERVHVVPTGGALGAEVRGVDLAEEIPPETRDALVGAWADHLVLLFRDQELTEERFLAAARVFGELQAATNSGAGSGALPWHSDNSYAAAPPAGTMLYAREVPPEGGNTYFTNQYRAYETLDDEVRDAIEGRTAVQDYSRDGSGNVRPDATLPTRPEEVPGAHHPIVRTHPLSGKRALYLGRRYPHPSQYIDGLPDEQSRRLLDIVWDHATDPAFVWCHVWRRGDLLLWDNRCTMHRRDPVEPTAPRIMLRTMISGHVPFSGE